MTLSQPSVSRWWVGAGPRLEAPVAFGELGQSLGRNVTARNVQSRGKASPSKRSQVASASKQSSAPDCHRAPLSQQRNLSWLSAPVQRAPNQSFSSSLMAPPATLLASPAEMRVGWQGDVQQAIDFSQRAAGSQSQPRTRVKSCFARRGFLNFELERCGNEALSPAIRGTSKVMAPLR